VCVRSPSQAAPFYTEVIRPLLEYACSSSLEPPAYQNTNWPKLKLYKGKLSESSTAAAPATYTGALYCAAVLISLADRREHLARKFLKSVLDPSSCPFTLLPIPLDSSITTGLRCANKFPRIATRTRKCHTFISYALSHYQCAYS